MAWMSPRFTVRLTSLSALTPGNSLVIERISRIGWAIASYLRVGSCGEAGWWWVPRRHGGLPGHPRQEVLLQVGVGVVTGVDQLLLDRVLGDRDRVQEVGRHDLLAVVVGL